MNIKTVIIADDFTGAGDSSIHFCHAGYSVYLPLTLANADFSEPFDILAVNTESRLDQGAIAYRKVAEAVAKCRTLGTESFYKKIDSTMRGNIADEIKAVIDKGLYSAAVICPATPELGRTVVDGQCLLNHIPIDRTQTGQDQLNPVKSSFIKDFFTSLESTRISHISATELECGPNSLKKKVNTLVERGTTHIICDATTREHLLAIATLKDDSRLLLAGASGLAAAIAEKTPCSDKKPASPNLHSGKTLVISGSRMDISRKQLEILADKRNFQVILIPVKALIAGDEDVLKKCLDDIRRFEDSNGNSYILTPDSHEDKSESNKQRINSDKIASFIAQATNDICRTLGISVLVSIGGHTTFKTVKCLDASGVIYEGEVIPGMPFGRLQFVNSQRSLTLITKSGSFGSEDALLRIHDFIATSMEKT